MRNAIKIVDGKPERKILGRSRCRWEDIKIGCGLDSPGSG
jgi:hypothetical protein